MTNKNKGPSAQMIASTLLDMHVKHELDSFNADSFMPWLKEDLEQLMGWLGAQRLDSFVSAEQVKETIHDTVVMHEIPGAIAEISGEAALQHFNSTWHLDTPLKDIMSARQFESFLKKFLELENQRTQAVNKIIDLPVYQELISGVLYSAITHYIYDSNLLSKNVPGVSSMLKISRNMFNKAVPKLGSTVEDNVRSYIEDNLSFIQQESKVFLNEVLAEDDLKASIMDFWDALEDKTMSEFQEGMDAMDLADFVVLGYEFWLKFRKTPYFRQGYESIVDYWFEKYGGNTLSDMFEDLDIQPSMILREAERYAPKLIKKLEASGQLELLIRRRLETFYQSRSLTNYLEDVSGSCS